MELNYIKVNPCGNTTVFITDSVPREHHAEVAKEIMAYGSIHAEQVGFFEKPQAATAGASASEPMQQRINASQTAAVQMQHQKQTSQASGIKTELSHTATNQGDLSKNQPDPMPEARLQMMGGEFCGNASRGFAAVLAYKSGICSTADITIEVSGAEKPLTCHVKPLKPYSYFVSMKMPPIKEIYERSISLNSILNPTNDALGVASEADPSHIHAISAASDADTSHIHATSTIPNTTTVTLIDFGGICHAVIFTDNASEDEEAIRNILTQLPYQEYDAFGIIQYNPSTGSMCPVVYVKGTDSLVFEQSCGSGTAAVGVAMAYKHKKTQHLKITQPGGVLEITAEYRNYEEVSARKPINGKPNSSHPNGDKNFNTEYMAEISAIGDLTLGGVIDITSEGKIFTSLTKSFHKMTNKAMAYFF